MPTKAEGKLDDWDQLEAFARLELDLTPQELGELTPRQLGIYVDHWNRKERRANLRAGMVCAAICNAILRPQRAFQPVDFVDGRKPQSPEEMIAQLKHGFGG